MRRFLLSDPVAQAPFIEAPVVAKKRGPWDRAIRSELAHGFRREAADCRGLSRADTLNDATVVFRSHCESPSTPLPGPHLRTLRECRKENSSPGRGQHDPIFDGDLETRDPAA